MRFTHATTKLLNMRQIFAIALIAAAAAAHGQSYDDRVAAERLQASLKAIDDAKMDEARRRADARLASHTEVDHIAELWKTLAGLGILLAGSGGLILYARRKARGLPSKAE